ncbi:MAG: ATP phosphoribosyltransferase, partial [Caulobacteraceae bacterium]
LDAIEVRLVSASDAAAGLRRGEFHLGVTGEDLLAEAASGGEVVKLLPLGFGRADLVVAVPKSWIDVETMDDLDEAARLFLARTGARMRVATKYPRQARAFFARHHAADFRIVESTGATEGGPAAGLCEAIVDITSTGATLAANGLKALSDGLILKSQACLLASLASPWDDPVLSACERLLAILEARSAGRSRLVLSWPQASEENARAAIAAFSLREETLEPGKALVAEGDVFAVAAALGKAGVGPISVVRPTYVFAAKSAPILALRAALGVD